MAGGIGPAAIGGRLAIAQSPCQSAARMKPATRPILIAVDGPAASGKGDEDLDVPTFIRRQAD